METDERLVIGIERGPFSCRTINWIWPVKNDNRYAGSLAGAHTEIHRPDERVIARSDILKINEQNIETFQHFRSRFAVFAVQTINGNVKTRVLVTFPFHHVVLGLAEKTVLRSKKRGEPKKIAVVSLENPRRVLKLR